MEQLSPQQVRSCLSGGQADSERTLFNARVTKDPLYIVYFTINGVNRGLNQGRKT